VDAMGIFEWGRFPHGTCYAIERQMKRLRFGYRIDKAEIPDLDGALARYVDACGA